MRINNRSIGEPGDSCFIIAEAGVNHNGDVKIAKELIHVAKHAGADAVKFQTFNVKELLSKNAPKVGYQLKNTNNSESQRKMLKKLQLSFKEFIELKQLCGELEIMFLSTPFDASSASALKDLRLVDAFKIPSSEIINLPLLELISSYNMPMIVSTGMCSLREVEDAVRVIGKNNIALLHCISNYPADPSKTNLKAMLTLKEAFKTVVGYSDHTPGISVSLAAVAMGASIIEKHFTLDRGFEGPDHKASLTPNELKEMITEIRIIESALGDGIKQPTEEELETAKALRKSMVASDTLPAGTIISKGTVCFKRPGTGYPPEAIKYLEGLKLKRKVKKDQLITKNDLL